MGIASAHRIVLAAVWERDVGDHMTTMCDCCEESLHYNDAILGHIIAKTFLSEEEVRGATTMREIDDICLLCRDCNARMGIMCVYDWKRDILQKVVTPAGTASDAPEHGRSNTCQDSYSYNEPPLYPSTSDQARTIQFPFQCILS